VTGAVVEVTVTGALPQWAGAVADASARQRWEALTADVRNRLAGMERDALAAAQDMDRQIEAMPSQARCDEVKTRAGQIVEAVKTRQLGGR
jgi:predicted secreted Zn-dependent protease